MRTQRPLRRLPFVAVPLLLTLSSSLAYGLVRRHLAWDGLVTGISTSKIRGPIEMVGGVVLGTTLATVSYRGDTPGVSAPVSRPWHVHVGSCAKGGRSWAPRAPTRHFASTPKAWPRGRQRCG